MDNNMSNILPPVSLTLPPSSPVSTTFPNLYKSTTFPLQENPDEELMALRTRVIIGLAATRLVLAAFGCVANVVASVVLTNRKLWSPTSMLLLSLVIYDACYLLLVIPVAGSSISANLKFTPERYKALRTITALCFPLRNMAQMGSTYTTLTVTAERFLVIFLPLRASSMWTYGKTRRAIIGVLLFTVLFNLPRCFDHILSKPRMASSKSSTRFAAATTTIAVATVAGGGGVYSRGEFLGGQDFDLSGGLSTSFGNSSSGSWKGKTPDDGITEFTYRGQESTLDGTGNNVTGNGSYVKATKDVANLFVKPTTKTLGAYETGRKGSEKALLKNNSTKAGNKMVHEDEEGVSEEVFYFYMVVYQFYLTAVFLYLIPYTLIPVLNLGLIIALRRRREESRRLSVKNEHRLNGSGTQPPSKSDKEDGLTYIVFGITICYFVCCILPAVYMISAIASDLSTNPTTILIYNTGETTLVINAATDFFFYCLLGRKFRHVFMRIFCSRRLRRGQMKKTNSFSMRTTITYNSV